MIGIAAAKWRNFSAKAAAINSKRNMIIIFMNDPNGRWEVRLASFFSTLQFYSHQWYGANDLHTVQMELWAILLSFMAEKKLLINFSQQNRRKLILD